MLVIYKGRTLPFELGRLTVREAIALKDTTGLTIAQYMQGLIQLATITKDAPVETLKALQFMIWLALTRNGEHIKPDDVDFDLLGDEWGFEMEEEDRTENPPLEPDTGTGETSDSGTSEPSAKSSG